MTGQISVILNQIIIFAILMSIGFITAKLGVITKEVLNSLSKLIVKIILPALIFSIIADSGLTTKDFLISGRFIISVILCFLILFCMGAVISKLFKLNATKANVFVALATFGNMGFMGIPLIQAIFKEPIAQVCISVYTIVDMSLLWTLGVFLCSRHQKDIKTLSAIRNMVNPTTVALIIAFLITVTRLPMPRLLMDTISGIGGTSKYLTLIYLGGMLACVSAKKLVKNPSILALTVGKMILIPITIYYLAGFILPETPRMILTIISGLPSMTTVVMLAANYKSDHQFATEVIFITTLASLFTIPLVTLIAGMM